MDFVIGTNSRADALRAALATTQGEHDLVLVCADDYAAAEAALAGQPAGRDVVNLTSGTREQAARLATRGRYLDGALMAHPEHVGDPATVTVYSGSAEVFDRHRERLAAFGQAVYLGPDPGTAALYDLALLNLAWATLTGYLQTAALLGSAGVRAAEVSPLITGWLTGTVNQVITEYAGQIDEGRYPGDGEWLELDAPLMDHLRDATRELGLDDTLATTVRSLTHRAIDAGHGQHSFASLVEIIRSGAPETV
ncbi:NAD(P)-dependent oxidoreductase [Amycolatopsis magusensis]|uniref:imine reductase family protein n=1 Tax=Amycolatopsis magusensis TaxID=882444 RepID=UPI0024A9451C|nr:NAD(P)-dependent oxidoreductase [Amycolatopsis magusensis]MDI5978835.1 NAD(P)-dependent oxidoreductase [Amycolatopsis magusensis]